MVKKILILSTFMLITLFPLNTFAFDGSTDIYLNSQKLTTQYKQYISGAQNVYVSIRGDANSVPDDTVYQYGYVALCSAFGSYSNRYVDTVGSSYVKDMAVVNSTTGCTIPTTNAYINTARVLYITYTIPPNMNNCGVSGPCYLSHDIDFAFYQTGSTEFSLVSYGFSNEPFNFNSQVDPSVIQNQQIIDQNQTIINQQNQNTQDIIDNQNQNTQQEIESQKICTYIDRNLIVKPNYYLTATSSEQPVDGFGITDFIPLDSKAKLQVMSVRSGAGSLCFYNSNKVYINCITNSSMVVDSFLTIPSNTSYIKATINTSQNRPTFQLCKDGNQALNDTLNDTSQPNTNQDIQDMDDMVASDTPISDLITMPLTLINAYINGMNATCSPVNLGNLYGTNLIIPCIDIPSKIGSDLWGKIDVICCIFMCYEIAMLFITAFDGITSLRDDFEGLYQPRHADTGYQPRHGGGN